MAPYDSDSSDDDDDGAQLTYTETTVLLGYADPEDQEADTTSDNETGGNETVSRLGGRPDWLVADQPPPSAALARCLVCKALLVLLLQLNGELPTRFPGHERRLYVLACRNKACRRKAGSVRVIRGVRVDEAEAASAAAAAEEKKTEAQKPKPAGAAPGLGESLFGVANPFSASGGSSGGSANPFSTGASSSVAAAKNPFSIGGASSAAAAKNPFSNAASTTPTPSAAAKPQPSSSSTPSQATAPPADDPAKDLPKTFAETLSLNSDKDKGASPLAPPAEPWPAVADAAWPAAYPVSWIAEAEYETLDPTPATIPGVSTESMEIDDGSGGGGSGGGKEDKFVFESSMDAAFQKFADRVAQNPDQVIRYEFGGQPLLYNRDDAVAGAWTTPPSSASISTVLAAARLPPCPGCRGRRVFEVQLMPHAIDLLEADELGLEGMDWGTVVVGVCEKDCQARGTRPGEASYQEEWAGVQWEELQTAR